MMADDVAMWVSLTMITLLGVEFSRFLQWTWRVAEDWWLDRAIRKRPLDHEAAYIESMIASGVSPFTLGVNSEYPTSWGERIAERLLLVRLGKRSERIKWKRQVGSDGWRPEFFEGARSERQVLERPRTVAVEARDPIEGER